MKRRIIIGVSIVMTVTIGAFLLIFFLGKNDEPKEKIGELRNIKIECLSVESYTYDLGEYFVYDYKESKNSNDRIYRVKFEVDDGRDFYNRIIKTSNFFSSDYDYDSRNYYISHGFLHDKLNFIYYKISPDSVELSNLYGKFTIPYNLDDMENMLDPITCCYIPGPIARNLDYKNPDLNTPSLYPGLYDINLSFESIVSLYSDLPYNFMEEHEDYLLIKGICYIDDFYDRSKLKDLFISEDYLCKISKYNDTVKYELINNSI